MAEQLQSPTRTMFSSLKHRAVELLSSPKTDTTPSSSPKRGRRLSSSSTTSTRSSKSQDTVDARGYYPYQCHYYPDSPHSSSSSSASSSNPPSPRTPITSLYPEYSGSPSYFSEDSLYGDEDPDPFAKSSVYVPSNLQCNVDDARLDPRPYHAHARSADSMKIFAMHDASASAITLMPPPVPSARRRKLLPRLDLSASAKRSSSGGSLESLKEEEADGDGQDLGTLIGLLALQIDDGEFEDGLNLRF